MKTPPQWALVGKYYLKSPTNFTFNASNTYNIIGGPVYNIFSYSPYNSTHKAHLLSRQQERSIEPLIERVAALKDGGQQKVEQGPQFRQLVLQRGASEEQSVRGDVVLIEDLSELAVMVLHSMTLVYNHVLPANLCT